jgi:hypothetical protein
MITIKIIKNYKIELSKIKLMNIKIKIITKKLK